MVISHRLFHSDLLDQLVWYIHGLGADAKGVMRVLPNMVSDSRTTRDVVQKGDSCLTDVVTVTMCDGAVYLPYEL